MAGPHPQQELERCLRRCRQGLPPVLVLVGPGAYFREQALQGALAAVPADAELRTVDGHLVEVRGLPAGEADAESAPAAGAGDAAEPEPAAACADLDAVRGGGLFFRRAFLVVRRADRWLRRHGEALAAFLPKLPTGCGIVLEAQRLDRRTRLGKELAAGGGLFEFRDLYETPFKRPDQLLQGELVQWVVEQSRKLAVLVTPEAALWLTARVGKSPGELLAELQRLRDQLGADPKRKALGPTGLGAGGTVSFESTPFELASAVLDRDRKLAFRALRAIFGRGVRQKDGRPMEQGGLFPFAVSWLFGQLGQLHEGRILLDGGTRIDDVPGQVGVGNFTERYLQHLGKNSSDQLERGMLQLLHCQRQRRFTGEEDEVLLERFLVAWFADAALPVRELEW